MKVLVIGANGKCGYLTIKLLKEKTDHLPIAMIRDPGQKARFEQIGVDCVQGDLEHPLNNQMKDIDAVIFAAGSGSKTGKDKTVTVDHTGAINSSVYASICGARRFIMLSSMNANPDSQSGIKHYHRAKAHADRFIMEFDQVMDSPLDWTIVCPGRLTDEPATGLVEVNEDINGSARTSREHVAMALASCLDMPNTIHKRFAIEDGGRNLANCLAKL